MAKPAGKPRAWGVLAVALALMALLAALTSAARPHAPSGINVAARGTTGAARTGASDPSSATATAPGSSSAASTPTTSVPNVAPPANADDAANAGDAAGSNPSASATSEEGHATVQETTGTAALAAGTTDEGGSASVPSTLTNSAAASVGSTPANHTPGAGNIAYPTESVTYITTGGGTVSATATWTGTTTLSLSIVCTSGKSTSRVGPSGLHVSLDDGAAPEDTCHVALALLSPPSPSASAVAYTLAITPAPQS